MAQSWIRSTEPEADDFFMTQSRAARATHVVGELIVFVGSSSRRRASSISSPSAPKATIPSLRDIG
jgi:hypothetical protein